MTFQDLPLLNAILNSLTVVLLTAGYVQIRKGNQGAHRKLMISAFVVSSLFLAGYLLHKFTVGPKLFPMQGWPRFVYLSILIPHTFLAIVNLPFILAALWFAATGHGCFFKANSRTIAALISACSFIGARHLLGRNTFIRF